MATTLTVNGSAVSLSTLSAWPRVLAYRYRGYSTLTIERRGGTLPAVPDGWLGKPVVLQMGGTTYFRGDVVSRDEQFTEIGWVTTYQCADLKARCDRVPLTDSNTLTDCAAYNLPADDPLSISSRQGRNAGQILTDVLTGAANAAALNARGVGAYTTLTPDPVLPASTVTDLSYLTVVPPAGCYVQGEKLLSSIEQFLQQWAPNYLLWIEPSTGALRFLDQRIFTNNTLTLGTDPVECAVPRRSVQDCYQRVIVRGQPTAERMVVSTKDGTLQEDFGYTAPGGATVSNSAAKGAWTPTQYYMSQAARSEGTCTCTSTTTVNVHATDATQVWDSNAWDQSATGFHGQIDLYYSAGAGLTMLQSRRIVANAAHTAGSTTQVTLDLALPSTNYDHYKIYGVANGLGYCWRRYSVVDTTVGHAMARQLTYPAPWVSANGDMAAMTSYPMGSVCWSASGNAPYEERPAAFTMDPGSSHLYFLVPTYITNGNRVPSDVRALLAVNTGTLTATYPPDSGGSPVYGGTSYTAEGMEETLTVTVLQWRDPANQAAMDAYAQDLHDSVKDTIVEGSIVYYGLYSPALSPGQALSIAGNGYTTGYEGLSIPILETQLHWNLRDATKYTTVMQVSNRRAHYTAEAFLRPNRWIGGQVVDYAGLNAVTGNADLGFMAADAAMSREVGKLSASTPGIATTDTPSNDEIAGTLAAQQAAVNSGGVGFDPGAAGTLAGQDAASDPRSATTTPIEGLF